MSITGNAQEATSVDGLIEFTASHAYGATEMTKVEEVIDHSVNAGDPTKVGWFEINVGIKDLTKVEYFAVKNSGTVTATLYFNPVAKDVNETIDSTPGPLAVLRKTLTLDPGESFILSGADTSPASPGDILTLMVGGNDSASGGSSGANYGLESLTDGLRNNDSPAVVEIPGVSDGARIEVLVLEESA